MRFFRDGEWHQVARITGPTHNLLGLKLGGSGEAVPAVEALTHRGEGGALDSEQVVRQVLDGVSEVNAQLNTAYSVRAVRYVTSDTASKEVYRLLAKVLIEHVHRSDTQQNDLQSAAATR